MTKLAYFGVRDMKGGLREDDGEVSFGDMGEWNGVLLVAGGGGG